MKRWQFGQLMISVPVSRLFAICGGMFRWQPLQVPATTGTTATPPRCLRMRSYLLTRERSQRSTSRFRSASSTAIRPCTPSRTLLISAPSRATTASLSASACSADSTCLRTSPYSPASRLISSSAVWLVFFAMSSSRASAAYSRGVFSSLRRDSHLRTLSFSSCSSCSFWRRARSLSASRPRVVSRCVLAWLRSASICLRRAGCFSASMERSRILRSTCCSSSNAFNFSRDNVRLRAGPAFSRLCRVLRALASARSPPPTWLRPDRSRTLLRAEGGNQYAPFGYVGGCLSWMIDSYDVLELGAGGGFPGVQLGFAARRLFGEGGQHLFAELFLSGNTRVNRGVDQPTGTTAATQATSSLWTGLGFGFEQRSGSLDFSLAGNIVFTSTSLTPRWAVHGGIGIGF